MINKTALFAYLVLFSFDAFAQLKNAPQINIGISRRPELFELANNFIRMGSYDNYQSNISQMNNPNLVVEFSQRLNHDRWALQLSNYFSKNYLATIYDSNNQNGTDISALKYDLFLDARYEIRFRKFKNSFIHVGTGFGKMNISRKFDYSHFTGEKDINGNWIYQKKSRNLSFYAPRIFAGFTYKKLSGFVTAHYTPDGDFRRKPSLWVEYKGLYTFSLGNKTTRERKTDTPKSNFKFNPSIEVGFAYRPGVIELSKLSKYPYLGPPRTTYAYNAAKHFNNVNLSIALRHYVVKQRISLQVASYYRYSHLYYGKNAQGISSSAEKEYKRLKYDLFVDGIYHFKKRTPSSVGVELGIGIGNMNCGSLFRDSVWRGNDYIEAVRGFSFLAPRIMLGLNKNNFSFFAIAHGTPDSYYDSNPTIWLEFKAAYAFSPFKKKKAD